MFELLKVDLFLDSLKLDVLNELKRPCRIAKLWKNKLCQATCIVADTTPPHLLP